MSVRIRVTALMLRFRGGDFFPGFGIVELGQLLFPFGGFLRLARGFVKLHEALKSFLHARFAAGWNSVLSLLHALVTREQQRLGLGVFLLPEQAAAHSAA